MFAITSMPFTPVPAVPHAHAPFHALHPTSLQLDALENVTRQRMSQ